MKFFLSLINVKIDSSHLYCNVEMLNVIDMKTSVLVSVILTLSHKKDACEIVAI